MNALNDPINSGPVNDEVTKTYMTHIPWCDFCKYFEHKYVSAKYDGKTKRGPWAYMCKKHFGAHHINGRLGLGLGQQLILRPAEGDN
jgi:hypothetical protein